MDTSMESKSIYIPKFKKIGKQKFSPTTTLELYALKKRKYKIKFYEKEDFLISKVKSKPTKNSLMSVYCYLIKIAEKDFKSPIMTFSLRDFLDQFNNGYRDKIKSPSTLNNRLNTLKELGLLKIEKVKQDCTYTLTRYFKEFFVDYSLDNNSNNNLNSENPALGVDITKLDGYTQSSNNQLANGFTLPFTTNDDIVENNSCNCMGKINQLANNYKGVTSSVYATKNQLKTIARGLLVEMELNSNTLHDNCVQWLVQYKCATLNKKIYLKGATEYVRAIILDKLEEVSKPDFNPPIFLMKAAQSTVNFTQRNYSKEELKEIEEAWLSSFMNGDPFESNDNTTLNDSESVSFEEDLNENNNINSRKLVDLVTIKSKLSAALLNELTTFNYNEYLKYAIDNLEIHGEDLFIKFYAGVQKGVSSIRGYIDFIKDFVSSTTDFNLVIQ